MLKVNDDKVLLLSKTMIGNKVLFWNIFIFFRFTWIPNKYFSFVILCKKSLTISIIIVICSIWGEDTQSIRDSRLLSLPWICQVKVKIGWKHFPYYFIVFFSFLRWSKMDGITWRGQHVPGLWLVCVKHYKWQKFEVYSILIRKRKKATERTMFIIW